MSNIYKIAVCAPIVLFIRREGGKREEEGYISLKVQ